MQKKQLRIMSSRFVRPSDADAIAQLQVALKQAGLKTADAATADAVTSVRHSLGVLRKSEEDEATLPPALAAV